MCIEPPPTMPQQITGKHLQNLWNIPAKHALYSNNGTWYHQLTSFPGALCDSEGYILFSTEQEFRSCRFLRIKKDVGCRGGIQQIPEYIRCDSFTAIDINPPSRPDRIIQHVSRIIRDTAISSELKLLYDHRCQLCETQLLVCERPYCEAHHIRPLGRPHDGSDNRENMICVCPNCHVLLDYAAIPLQIGNMKHSKHQIAEASITYHNSLHKAASESIRKAKPVKD